jgi:hypothetical protein
MADYNVKHGIHQFDAVGTFNPNCDTCQEMAKSMARYLGPDILAIIKAQLAIIEKEEPTDTCEAVITWTMSEEEFSRERAEAWDKGVKAERRWWTKFFVTKEEPNADPENPYRSKNV